MSLGTRDALVRAAEHLLRTKGYAAFSYADLAAIVPIQKASIHHHFPTKEHLGVAVVQAYIERTIEEFERIERTSSDVMTRLVAFSALFQIGSKSGLLPLCGALAAEMAVLPESLQGLAKRFFSLELQWLTRIIDAAVVAGGVPSGQDIPQRAYQILSLLEGGCLIESAMKDGRRVDPMLFKAILGIS